MSRLTNTTQEIIEAVHDVVRKNELVLARVKSISLFGSFARGESNSDSDVDLLVEFTEPVGLFTLMGLKCALEDVLKRKVDIGTVNSLSPFIKDDVVKEAVRIYEG